MAHSALTEFRIERIAQRMRRFRWRKGKSVRELAAEWQLSESWVSDLADIASKRVLAEMTDPDGVTLDVCAGLRKVLSDALRDADKASKAGEYGEAAKCRKNAIDAAKQWATIAGLVGKKGPAAPGQLEFPSAAAAVAFLDEVRAQIVERERDVTALPAPPHDVGGSD